MDGRPAHGRHGEAFGAVPILVRTVICCSTGVCQNTWDGMMPGREEDGEQTAGRFDIMWQARYVSRTPSSGRFIKDPSAQTTRPRGSLCDSA
jgi:hypothetical protein